jgi:hypothetical protein
MDSQNYYHDESHNNENKILDLTGQEDDSGEEGQYICDHCEIPMQKSDEDLSTVSGTIVVKQGS